MTSRRKSTPAAVPEQLQPASPDDALRTMLTTLLQSMVEEEFAAFLGAAPEANYTLFST